MNHDHALECRCSPCRAEQHRAAVLKLATMPGASVAEAFKHDRAGARQPEPARAQTVGEKAVGLTFNPGGNAAVDECKRIFAAAIDQMDALRKHTVDGEVKRMASVAITEAQTAQMWAVKAITWRG